MAEQKLVDAKALRDALYEADAITMKGVVIINQFPTIEAKPVVHAHWQKYDDSEFCYCSYCGKPAAEDDDVSWHGYCPICGATMDEELERLNCGAQMDEEINNG